MKKVVIIVIILVVILAAIFILNTEQEKEGIKKGEGSLKQVEGKYETTKTESTEQPPIVESVKEKVIEITSSGFNPKNLEINVGNSVKFVNKDSENHWPASAIHPTHTVYPGSNINKCGTGEESLIFDACKGLSQGESYSFTFNEKGSWGYHDHLSPSLRGTIVVN